tara:strand:- start:1446 stop:2840 length:1395 start_codon:yes stop_codon:yes gene_type:complete
VKVIVLPPFPVRSPVFVQAWKGLEVRFGDDLGLFEFRAIPPLIAHFQEHIGAGRRILPLDEAGVPDAETAVFFLADQAASLVPNADAPDSTDIAVTWSVGESRYQIGFRVRESAGIFTVDGTGGVRPVGRAIGSDEDPGLEAHVFNRLGPRDLAHAANFTYFPFGYLYRDASWGGTNDLGFRSDQDFDALSKRDATHKVVACYGGSAAWGWECLPDQVWTSILQAELDQVDDEYRYTVVNLAVPGFVVLNEMFTHLMHAQKLRPDIVVALNGANDLWLGQGADPLLLAKYQIAYQYEHTERWAQRLHQSEDRPTTQPPAPERLRQLNHFAAVLRAYVARVRQFRNLIRQGGGRFVWALQPLLPAKSAFSDMERERTAREDERGREFRANSIKLYELLERELPDEFSDDFLNLHDLFRTYGADENLFWDFVHPGPDGQHRIAEHVAAHLLRHGIVGCSELPGGSR